MLQLFKNNHFLNSLLLLPLTLILHMSIFFYAPTPKISGAGYLGREILQAIEPESFWGIAIHILLIFFQATLINRMVIMHRLGQQITLIPGLLWIALSALHPDLMGFSAPSMAILLLLIGMNSLFNAYQKKNSATNIFNTGFFMGLSSLFYYPLTLLLIFGIIGLYTIRNIRKQEVNQYAIGWITPYFLFLCYAYVFDSIQNFTGEQWVSNWAVFDLSKVEKVSYYPFWIMATLIFAVCILNYSMYFSKKIIYAQKKIGILFTYLVFAFIPVFFIQDPGIIYTLLLLWPIAYFLSESLISLTNQMLSELFAWMIILFSFFMQYQTIL